MIVTHFRRLLARLQTATTVALNWLTTTDAGNVVLLVLTLVGGLCGIMGLRMFAPR